MNIGIVGPELAKFTPETRLAACRIILALLQPTDAVCHAALFDLVRDLEAAPPPETERREIASFRGLRYWCASCMAHFGALLPDGDVCCNDCGLIITSVKKDA
ncbi:MAG: hypothetical protein E6R03_08835 [Hyphomicrobiaceae bacterium]|nr:MAG: hypothetical protein E6R03_08835 [Hyphomicrobiaceae bacterium]